METLGLKYYVQEDNQLKPGEQIHNGHFFQWPYQQDQNPSTKLNQNFFQPKPSEVIRGKYSKQQKPTESQNGKVLKWKCYLTSDDGKAKCKNEITNNQGLGRRRNDEWRRKKEERCSRAECADEETKKEERRNEEEEWRNEIWIDRLIFNLITG